MSFIVYFNINLLLCLIYVLVFHVTLKKKSTITPNTTIRVYHERKNTVEYNWRLKLIIIKLPLIQTCSLKIIHLLFISV